MADLQGRTALVTGASRRLGRGIALRLAGEGCSVAVHYRSSESDANQLADEIRGKGVNSWLIQSNLSSRSECERLMSSALRSAGKIDFLVNNASIFPLGDILNVKKEDAESTLLVNSWAPLWLSSAFASSSTGGAIVNMLDGRITGYDFSNFPYYMSKRMLADVTENLALRLAPGIRVNGVAPGLVLPPEGKDEGYLRKVSRIVPLKMHGSVSDVSDAVIFLLRSDFITGQTIFVDGGQHLLHHIFGNVK